jgi:hypothetical protein
MISLFELLYLIAREVKDRPVPPTDPRAATDQVNATLKAKLKKPFFVANPDGSIVIVTPDTSDLGFHFFSPDSADTPLDDAAPPAPAPAP